MTDEEGGLDPAVQTYLEFRWEKAARAFESRGDRTLSGGDLDDEVALLLSTKKGWKFARILEWIIHEYQTDSAPIRSVEGVVSKIVAKDGGEYLILTTFEGPLGLLGAPKEIQPNHRYVFRDLERRNAHFTKGDVWLQYGHAVYSTETGSATLTNSTFEEREIVPITPPREILVESPIRGAIFQKIREVGFLDGLGSSEIEAALGLGPKGTHEEIRKLLEEKVVVRLYLERQVKIYLAGSEPK